MNQQETNKNHSIDDIKGINYEIATKPFPSLFYGDGPGKINKDRFKKIRVVDKRDVLNIEVYSSKFQIKNFYTTIYISVIKDTKTNTFVIFYNFFGNPDKQGFIEIATNQDVLTTIIVNILQIDDTGLD